jgi:hypothetical protein
MNSVPSFALLKPVIRNTLPAMEFMICTAVKAWNWIGSAAIVFLNRAPRGPAQP